MGVDLYPRHWRPANQTAYNDHHRKAARLSQNSQPEGTSNMCCSPVPRPMSPRPLEKPYAPTILEKGREQKKKKQKKRKKRCKKNVQGAIRCPSTPPTTLPSLLPPTRSQMQDADCGCGRRLRYRFLPLQRPMARNWISPEWGPYDDDDDGECAALFLSFTRESSQPARERKDRPRRANQRGGIVTAGRARSVPDLFRTAGQEGTGERRRLPEESIPDDTFHRACFWDNLRPVIGWKAGI